MKRYVPLFQEDITDIPSFAWEELSRYNLQAGKRLNKNIIDYFQEFKPNHPITVYRGLGFSKAQAITIMKKLRLNKVEVGARGIYQTGKIQSWSVSKEQAQQFVGSFLMGGFRDDSSLGLLLKIEKLFPKDIAIPTAFMDKIYVKKYLAFDQDEILLMPGKYNIVIEEVFGNWEDSSSFDIKKEILEIGKKMAQKTGGVFGKTWNKVPSGFSIHFPDIYVEKKWAPGIEVSIDNDTLVSDIFYGADMENKAKELNIKFNNSLKNGFEFITFDSAEEAHDFLQNGEVEKFILENYNKIKKLYNRGWKIIKWNGINDY